jgi:hypothetical protein
MPSSACIAVSVTIIASAVFVLFEGEPEDAPFETGDPLGH